MLCFCLYTAGALPAQAPNSKDATAQNDPASGANANSRAPAHEIAIKAGHLVDVDSGTVLSDQLILIRDNRIVAVGKALAIPPGATVIDLSNLTVLPGLIDCHTHLADGARDPSGDPLSYLKRTAA
jgi:adenine deaminase